MSEEINRRRHELAEDMRRDLESMGITDWAPLQERIEQLGLPRRGAGETALRHVFTADDFVVANLQRTGSTFAAVAAVLDKAEEYEARRRAVFDLGQPKSSRRPSRDGDVPVTNEQWLGVLLAEPPGRRVTTVDLVDLKQKGHEIWGEIQRLVPTKQNKRTWNFKGFEVAGAYYWAFISTSHDNLNSSGTVALGPDLDYLPRKLSGYYCRHDTDAPSGSPGNIRHRIYTWYSRLPTEYFPDVALLDFDNTLRSGWLIRDWIRSWATRDLALRSETRREFDRLWQLYDANELTHDQLAELTADAYSAFVRANSPEDLEESAEAFITQEVDGSSRSFVSVLITYLKSKGVAPVVITGAPEILARKVCDLLGVDDLVALTLDETGLITTNPGTRRGKSEAVSSVLVHGRRAVLGAGDSDSDRPLVERARVPLLAGRLVESFQPQRATFAIDENTDPAVLEDWLEENLTAHLSCPSLGSFANP